MPNDRSRRTGTPDIVVTASESEGGGAFDADSSLRLWPTAVTNAACEGLEVTPVNSCLDFVVLFFIFLCDRSQWIHGNFVDVCGWVTRVRA